MKPILIWLGAGKASTTTLEPAKYKKIILVEALPKLCDKLLKVYQPESHVEVINACVSLDSSPSVLPFNIFNLVELSSLKAPTGLYELFPGLKITRTIDLEICELTDVLGELEAENEYELIIDLPDIAGQVIEKLISTELIHYFKKIIITCGSTSLYDGAYTCDEITRVLKQEFFKETFIDDNDPDLLVVTFSQDSDAKKIALLEQQVSELQQYVEEEKLKRKMLIEERDELKVQSKDLCEENQRLRDKCEIANDENKDLNEKLLVASGLNKKLEEEVTSLQLNLEQQINTANKLKQNSLELSQDIEHKAQHILATEQSLEKLSQENEMLDSLVSSKQAELDKQLDQLQQAMDAKRISEEVRTQLEDDLTSLKVESKKFEQQYEQALLDKTTKLETAEKELEKLKQVLKSDNEARTKLEASLANLKVEHEATVQQYKQEVQDKCTELEVIKKELESAILGNKANIDVQSKLEESLANLKTEHEATVQQYKQALKEKTNELESIHTELESVRQSHKSSVEARSLLEENLANLKVEYEKALQQNKQALEDKIAELANLEKELESLTQAKKASYEKCRVLEEKEAEISDEKKNLEEVFQTHKEKYKALEQYNEALKRKAEESNRMSLQHSATLALTAKQNMKLQIDIDNLRTKYAEKVESERSLNELIADLHEKLQQAANFYRNLESNNPELLGEKK